MAGTFKNFTLDEFIASDTARGLGIDNTPSTEVVAHIGELVGGLLQPLRDAWGKAIIVSSGYRCEVLNKVVGGAKNSSHLTGYAADILVRTNYTKFKAFVRDWIKDKAFDQCIIEKSKTSEWIHISIRKNNGDQRRELFSLNV